MSNVGYYKLTIQSTGHFYVGSSSRLSHRIYSHERMLDNGRHHAVKFQAAYVSWNDILVETFPTCSVALARLGEQELLDKYLDTPLCCNVARSSTDPTLGVITIEMRRATIKYAEAARLSKPVSEETKARMSQSHMGMTRTDETKQAISESKSTPVILDGVRYNSISEASRILNMNHNTIRTRIRSKSLKYRDWRFLS